MYSKYSKYLEFLGSKPLTRDVQSYKEDLTEENKREFQYLWLFCFLEMEKLATKRNMIALNGFYFSYFILLYLLTACVIVGIMNMFYDLDFVKSMILVFGLTSLCAVIQQFVTKKTAIQSMRSFWNQIISDMSIKYNHNPELFISDFLAFKNSITDHSFKKWNKLLGSLFKNYTIFP